VRRLRRPGTKGTDVVAAGDRRRLPKAAPGATLPGGPGAREHAQEWSVQRSIACDARRCGRAAVSRREKRVPFAPSAAAPSRCESHAPRAGAPRVGRRVARRVLGVARPHSHDRKQKPRGRRTLYFVAERTPARLLTLREGPTGSPRGLAEQSKSAPRGSVRAAHAHRGAGPRVQRARRCGARHGMLRCGARAASRAAAAAAAGAAAPPPFTSRAPPCTSLRSAAAAAAAAQQCRGGAAAPQQPRAPLPVPPRSSPLRQAATAAAAAAAVCAAGAAGAAGGAAAAEAAVAPPAPGRADAAGGAAPPLPVYSRADVAAHNSRADGIWVTYKARGPALASLQRLALRRRGRTHTTSEP
jgi:hypothetical protein